MAAAAAVAAHRRALAGMQGAEEVLAPGALASPVELCNGFTAAAAVAAAATYRGALAVAVTALLLIASAAVVLECSSSVGGGSSSSSVDLQPRRGRSSSAGLQLLPCRSCGESVLCCVEAAVLVHAVPRRLCRCMQ